MFVVVAILYYRQFVEITRELDKEPQFIATLFILIVHSLC